MARPCCTSRPGQSHRGEASDVDLGVDRRSIEAAVAQDVGDLFERRSGAQQPPCNAMPQDV